MKVKTVFQRFDSFNVTAVSICGLEFNNSILAKRHTIGPGGHEFNDSDVEGHRRRGRSLRQPNLTSRILTLTLKRLAEIDKYAAGIIYPSRGQDLLPLF